jgi:ABC-type Mn/Zn transport systems, ATPase component
MSSDKFLECKNLTLAYDNHVAVEQVSFSLNKGDYLYIVGENGSGKSTLIKGILNLLPAKQGEIKFFESRNVGYLPQQTSVQRDFPASVNEVVLSGCLDRTKMLPFYNAKDRQKAKSAIDYLKIAHLAKKSFRELSGGERQRVLLARALCCEGSLLVLDEPVNGLDPIATNEMYELILQLNQEKKITVIMISHDIESALKYADKILHMEKRVLFFGSTSAYVNSSAGAAFLHKHCHGGESHD